MSVYTKYLGFKFFYKSLYRSLDKKCSLKSSCFSSESIYESKMPYNGLYLKVRNLRNTVEYKNKPRLKQKNRGLCGLLNFLLILTEFPNNPSQNGNVILSYCPSSTKQIKTHKNKSCTNLLQERALLWT